MQLMEQLSLEKEKVRRMSTLFGKPKSQVIKHPGALTRAAKRAGMSNSEYEKKHKHDSGVSGERSRLAITMKGWQH